MFDSVEDFCEDESYVRAVFKQGIEAITNSTCIKIVENENAPNRIKIGSYGGCWSHQGMIGGEQYMSLTRNSLWYPGTTTHQFMHALGFGHTQNRHDRDDFLDIFLGYVDDDLKSNFDKTDSPTEIGPYDYGSIMHGSPGDWVNKQLAQQQSMNPKEYKWIWTVGSRHTSMKDLEKINEYYKCSSSCKDPAPCENGGYQNPKSCSECICPTAYRGKYCNDIRVVYVEPNLSRGTLENLANLGVQWNTASVEIHTDPGYILDVDISFIPKPMCMIGCSKQGIEIFDPPTDMSKAGRRCAAMWVAFSRRPIELLSTLMHSTWPKMSATGSQPVLGIMVCTRSGTVKKLGVRTPRKCKERPATKITQKSARAAKKLTPKKSEDPLEIMAMVALYSYPRQCLSKKEICDAIRERFDNLPTTRFVTRVTAALRSSTIFEEIHNFNGSRGPGWKFTNKNLGAMKKLVDAFVDKNPDLARTHRIEKSDSDKRGSPASAAPLVQLPATVPKIHAKPLRGRGKTVQGTGSMDDVTPDDNNALVVANHVEADKPMEQEHAPVQRVAVKQEIEGEADDSMNEDYPPVQRVTVKREADESMEVELVGLSEMVGDTLIIGHPNGKKYVVKDTIGQGSFGQVHLVTNRNEGKFALKVSPVDEGNTTEDDFYKKVLKAERCRFIAAKYPLFKTRLEGVIQRCEIMDLYGRDLYDVLFTDAVSFTPLQILEFVFQLTTALQHIDKMGYIHADIKPENLMLVNYDPERTHQPYHLPIEVRLIDFNSMMDKDNDEPFGFVGQSVPYRAPEMALEMPCDQRIDVWSAGVCAMQMLDRDFIVIGDEEVAPFGEGEQRSAAILGEIERVFGSIPAHMKKMSRFHNFCEKASFPSILNRDGIYCNLNNSLHKHLPGDSRTEDKLKAILKRMLRVDVDKRRFAYEIREDLELFLDA